MNLKQRQLLASKLMDLANLGYVSLVIGQVLADNFEVVSVGLGMTLFIVLYIVSIIILQGGH